MDKKISHNEPPYYAFFEHPDGSWYMLWMTSSQPKTQRGNKWHVHAAYDKYGTSLPNLESEWYEKPYGTANWDFESLDEAIDHFYEERFLLRLKHGYEIIIANIPEDWMPKD